MGGVRPVAEILNFMVPPTNLGRRRDPRIRPGPRQKILDEMFVFENLNWTSTTARSSCCCANPVRLADPRDEGASPELREKIFRTCRSAPLEMLREDLKRARSVRLSEVEAEAEGNPQDRPPWPTKARSCSAVLAVASRCLKP